MSLSLAPFPCRLRVRGRMPCLQCQRCRLHEEGECEGPALRSLRSLCTGGRSELSIFLYLAAISIEEKKKHSKKLLNVGSQAAHVAIMSQLTRRGVFSWFMDLLGGRYRIEHKWQSQLVAYACRLDGFWGNSPRVAMMGTIPLFGFKIQVHAPILEVQRSRKDHDNHVANEPDAAWPRPSRSHRAPDAFEDPHT